MSATVEIPADSIEAAKAARLRYVTDCTPGIRRVQRGRSFCYVDPEGKIVRDRDLLSRIRSLVIPPAWKDVWICPLAHGHLQATGRDARGRKQYRYHARWREVRDETKYGRLAAFGEKLTLIRKKVDKDLALPGLPRERVLATVVRLLRITGARVGNQEYARENNSFGLTTLRDKHASIDGSRLEFRFRGKAGRDHFISVTDQRLARIVKKCRDIPGYELFQYIDDSGERRAIDSADVNDYLRNISGEDFTAKDFRTWAGTVYAAVALKELGPARNYSHAKKNVMQAIRRASESLGNTPAVCRKCYIHPAVIDSYMDGVLIDKLDRCRSNGQRNHSALSPEERMVLSFLKESETQLRTSGRS